MSVKVVLLPGEPIMLTTLDENFDMKHDAPDIIRQMVGFLDAATEPLYMLDDMLQLKLSFSDMVAGLGLATRGETDIVHHPRLRGIVIVTSSDIIKFGTTALKQAQYGGKEVSAYTSMDEALAAIRMELSRQQV